MTVTVTVGVGAEGPVCWVRFSSEPNSIKAGEAYGSLLFSSLVMVNTFFKVETMVASFSMHYSFIFGRTLGLPKTAKALMRTHPPHSYLRLLRNSSADSYGV